MLSKELSPPFHPERCQEIILYVKENVYYNIDNRKYSDYLIYFLHLLMDLTNVLHKFNGQVITHQMLMSMLTNYKRPHDKIHDLQKKGFLTSLKRGIYIGGSALDMATPEMFLIANHILGPSYISLDSALSYYNLIPEQVFETSSVTTKKTSIFSTPKGAFSYTHLQLPYYAFGIKTIKLSNNQYVLMASKEKAIFDKVVCSTGIVLRSKVAAYQYLVENLRVDEAQLKKLDTKEMKSWLNEAPKKESLLMVLKMIENL